MPYTFWDHMDLQGFNPIFRHFDHPHHGHRHSKASHCAGPKLISPRFDVRELNDSYQLEGEFPGIQPGDIDIEFSDRKTLIVKGHYKRQHTDIAGDNSIEENTTSPAEEPTSPKVSHQPTVEDEDASETNTPATETSENKQVVPQISNQKAVSNKAPAFKYRSIERTFGEFQRSFTFPTWVNQDAVRATLKDGILTIVVPKENAPQTKRIRIE